MQIYLVGGAVRDSLLGREVKENDWVIVGATPEQMIELGFKPVGKDFPVFLHPKTNEEYALARTERKQGRGYKGFVFHTGIDVTLEEDLKRRDLTINAIAQDDDGNIIDPYNGQKDLKNKIFRHVSKAFIEDPLRVIRVARFAAKLPEFNLHPDTLHMMQEISASNEIEALEPQRVWKEIARALNEEVPSRFFEYLELCDALKILFPELEEVEIAIKRLAYAASLGLRPEVLWAALLYHTDSYHIKLIDQRLNTPKKYHEIAYLSHESCPIWANIENNNAEEYLQWLKMVDAFRRPERFKILLEVCKYCEECNGILKAEKCDEVYESANQITAEPFVKQGLKGLEIGKAIDKARIEAISKIL